MTVVSGPEDLVWKVKIGRMSAHDALLILKRMEKDAKPEELKLMGEVRGFLEDTAATERQLDTLLQLRAFHMSSGFVRMDRNARMADGAAAQGKKMERAGIR